MIGPDSYWDWNLNRIEYLDQVSSIEHHKLTKRW